MGNKDLVKLCVICGDRATGYNFNAVCCESCKAFFRRNASKYEAFKCHFENNCRIDLVSRKFCKKCRMKKCFDLGMKKEWILNDEQKSIRRNKIEENRRKRKSSGDGETDSSPKSMDTNSSHDSSDHKSEKSNSDAPDGETKAASIAIPESVYAKTAEFEMSLIPIARPVTDLTDKFNDLEMTRLAELLNATHILKSPVVPITSEAMTMDDGCNVWRYKCEQEILKIIKMSKCLDSFQKLCENDQIALVKYGSIEIYCLRLTLHYNFDKEYWTLVTKPKAIKNLDEIIGISSPDSTSDPSPLSSNDVIAKNMDIEKYIDDSEKFAKEHEISLIPVLRQLSVNQNFNDLEYKRFSELLNAANVLKTPLNEMSSKIKCLGDAQRVMRFVLDRDIKNIIAFTKNLKGFEMLCEGDQISLIKYGCIDLLYMRSVLKYNYDNQYWNLYIDNKTSVKLDLEILRGGQRNIYGAHKTYLQQIGREWDRDSIIIDLLTSIVLFNPNRPNLEHPDIVKLQQYIYLYLLQRYLTVKYQSDSVLRTKFSRLMSVLSDVYFLGETQMQIVADRSPVADCSPLLKEVFNMKGQ
ncbi:unnamed protein product [Oppiella nova]|uniref:Uncharacterized protein n=1 Tax=Oppiella nova TaxID=334625 RepID=A0A7R9LZR2_9ACAR|nr:unnamed protein product [Oppiella nova]CAG2168562.1 unnamed protein product [Oppiella nova]